MDTWCHILWTRSYTHVFRSMSSGPCPPYWDFCFCLLKGGRFGQHPGCTLCPHWLLHHDRQLCHLWGSGTSHGLQETPTDLWHQRTFLLDHQLLLWYGTSVLVDRFQPFRSVALIKYPKTKAMPRLDELHGVTLTICAIFDYSEYIINVILIKIYITEFTRSFLLHCRLFTWFPCSSQWWW